MYLSSIKALIYVVWVLSYVYIVIIAVIVENTAVYQSTKLCDRRRAEQGRAGQGRAEQGRTEQSSAGYDRTGQGRT